MPTGPRVFETTARSVLTKSKIPGLDYAVNPYVGCGHACVYCYATFMRRFLGISDEWGDFVGIKVNAAHVLAREARRKTPGVVSFGTVCDPYQDVERDYGISRKCLSVFVDVEGFDVGVLTKSDLVVRDVDVLERIGRVDVGFTVTTLDPGVAAALEPAAPSPARRVAAMRALSAQGISVWGFLGPVLPGLPDSDEELGAVLEALSEAGASHVLVDRLNLYPSVLANMRRVMRGRFPTLLPVLEAARSDPAGYEAALRGRVVNAASECGIDVDVCF